MSLESLKKDIHFLSHKKAESSLSLNTPATAVNDFFSKVFVRGKIIEIGMLPGQYSQAFLASLMVHLQCSWVWIRPDDEKEVYPPFLEAFGADLSKIYFLSGNSPFKKFRPLFLSSTFPLILLESPQIHRSDMAALSQLARKYQYLVMVWRPFKLREERGNAYAFTRLNLHFHSKRREMVIQKIKGPPPINLRCPFSFLTNFI